MDRSRSSVPSWLVNTLLSLVALGLLGLTVWMKWDQIRAVFRGDHPIDGRLLVLAFAINVAGLVLTFIRWFFLVRALGLPFQVRDAVRLGFIGNVFNLVIPGAVGGDVIKAAFLCREQARKTQAVASMVIDRLLGLLGLFLLAGISGAWAWPGAGPEVRRLIVVVWLAVAAGVLGLTVLFTPALYRPLERLVAGRGRLEVLFVELVAMASAYRRRLAVVLGALAMAMGNHSLNVLSFYLVSKALFASLPTLA
jgi:glycosyltransferase 2 family protein